MNKTILALTSVILAITLSGCIANQCPASNINQDGFRSESSSPELSEATIKNDILSSLKYIPEEFEVNQRDGIVRVRIVISTSTPLEKFEEHSIATINLCSDYFSDTPYSLDVIYHDHINDGVRYSLSSNTDNYCFITNGLIANCKAAMLVSENDLLRFFEGLAVFDSRLSIYSKVMEAMDDMSRTEDEIIHTYSEQYGMSDDELLALISEMMDIIYSPSNWATRIEALA